ncbi:MAG: hypothetical protein JWR90_2658 [Marmoricola sp.]|nr:hypothetical protein [Marmoricola sp.]
MSRRLPVLACALALSLTAPQAVTSYAAAATQDPTQAPTATADPAPAVEQDLARLRSDAAGKLRVHRASDGTVDHVSSTSGRAMVEARGTTGAAPTATDQLARYGDAFGIDGSRSRAVVEQTLRSATGGSVVRAAQVVDGVPVFGGQVVLSLDADQGVVSVTAATTPATDVPAAAVSEARARQVALAFTAKAERTPVGGLTATGLGRRLYDPAIVHTADPGGARPVWQFSVTNGSDVRETVLVGTGRGEIALHYNDAPSLDRIVCDNHDAATVTLDQPVPACTSPARTETGAASAVDDVNEAFANLGATAATYQAVDGVDLTALIGTGTPRSLMSTVRWCFDEDTCPMQNAFWDGRQMVFGDGYAGADDVVGHELTHGYVERTAGLFALHESGALNESVADVMGEIVDHRNPPTDDDSAWTLGEDLSGGDLRSLKNPTLYGQPDRIRSALWGDGDYLAADGDGGSVHQNDGVGNKTAYLVSQGTSGLPGGTFNGQTIAIGIDNGDAGLAKTGRLWLETVKRLTSGSEYADFGLALGTTCDELASAGTGGFTSDDCVVVRKATTATELALVPTDAGAAAPEVAASCPTGSVQTLIERDDDDANGFGLSSTSSLWGRAPNSFVPSYATSGTKSLFGLNPDPGLDDPAMGDVTSAPFTVPVTTEGTYLNFHHAFVFEYDDQGHFFDGGRVIVSELLNGVWTPVTDLPWVNGPDRHVVGSTPSGFTGFGGDSYGYGSSQVDLSSLAGRRVRVAFRVEGDSDYSFLGWWIDDVRLYGCDTAALPPPAPVSPTGPTALGTRGAFTSAVVSWQPPADPGSKPITSYRLTRSDRRVVTVPGTSRSVNLTGFHTAGVQSVAIQAINGDGRVGPAGSVRLYASGTSFAAPVKAKKDKPFTITARVVKRGSAILIGSMGVVLQRKPAGQSYWSNLATGVTNARGLKSWSVRQKKATSYRVLAKGGGNLFGSTSPTRLVKKK